MVLVGVVVAVVLVYVFGNTSSNAPDCFRGVFRVCSPIQSNLSLLYMTVLGGCV